MFPEELEAWLAEQGVPTRPEHCRRAVAQVVALGRDTLTPTKRPMPKAMVAAINEGLTWQRLTVVERVEDPADGFTKYLFESPDGALTEAVRIPLAKPDTFTVCLSSQVGCAMGCVFCATGRLGLSRNLEAWEMLSAFLTVRDEAPGRVTGAVFQGQGEPLHYLISAHQDLTSPQTDLYSLGVILFWLLAGEPPFPRDSPVVLVARHILAPPRPLLEVAPTVPDGVAALVDQCLEKAPADRPATANEVVGRFATALDREPEELPVVPWEEARTGELWVAKPPAAGEPGEAAEQDSTTVGASSASTSAVTSAVTRRHAPAAGHGTDLDVPGLDTAFKEASEERPPEAALTTAADTARGARTPARRSWHLAALVLLVAVGAVLVAMAAKNDPAPQAPDGAVAPADAAVPDAALAPAPDSRPAPDARIDRAPELRAQQAPRRPGGRKVPRPPRRPGARKDRCSESRVGESTMNPFGKACPKPGK